MNTRRNHRGSLGRRGENAAARYLRDLGWQVVDRNWRCQEGELDIVAYDGQRHVVCEVKTRANVDFGAPLEAITATKAARLRRLAWRWADEHGVSTGQIRIDVIGLICDGPDGFSVDHCREVC
jgi:putative endonuclease